MIDVKQVGRPEQKSDICNTILRSLPGWFGVEASIVDYVSICQAIPFWAAFDGDTPIGFIALKEHNCYTSEICVMGILQTYHRHGIGRALIEQCISYCNDHHTEFLTVKTLDGSVPDENYSKTRKFYHALGFRPLEVFPLHWDADNPCLFMTKYLPAYF